MVISTEGVNYPMIQETESWPCELDFHPKVIRPRRWWWVKDGRGRWWSQRSRMKSEGKLKSIRNRDWLWDFRQGLAIFETFEIKNHTYYSPSRVGSYWVTWIGIFCFCNVAKEFLKGDFKWDYFISIIPVKFSDFFY